MGYDIIGDIHGHADKLEALLKRMGYAAKGRGYVAPLGRQAVFVGDFIDRGPKQLRVLEIVRAMIDSADALAVMGNHEFNAIGFVTEDGKGGYLRPNSEDKRAQHAEFLAAVGEGSATHKAWVDWFRTLPLVLDLGGIRVAHAWWDNDAVAAIDGAYWDKSSRVMSESFLRDSYVKNSPVCLARKILTCGVEWDLPEGLYIEDASGHRHGDARLAVWRHWALGLRELALVPRGTEEMIPDIDVPRHIKLEPIEGSPILFGHHWFNGTPVIETPKVACLDWSAAKTGCPLVAYRWNGESVLTNDVFLAAG